jgi:hypothetical protein
MRWRILTPLKYFLVLTILFMKCANEQEPMPVDCSLSSLAIAIKDQEDPTSCAAQDGSILVTVSGGATPYQFSLNGGTFGSDSLFEDLGGGNFIVRVRDKQGCERSVPVTLTVPGVDPLTASVAVTPDTECFGNNGSVEVEPSGGDPPYTFKLGGGAFVSNPVFTGLGPGNYFITVKDDASCEISVNATVLEGDSQTSLSDDVEPIIDSKCATPVCHGGSQSPNLISSQNIISNAQAIKRETQSGNMPRNGTLTGEQKALIACWVDEGAKDN